MKAYLSGKNAQLCIDPETEEESAILTMWHSLNISDQTMYCDMVESSALAGLRLCGVTDTDEE